MEQIHAHRDQTTRDFHNKIETHRQRDSGLRGMIRSLGDPEKNAHRWRQQLNALPGAAPRMCPSTHSPRAAGR